METKKSSELFKKLKALEDDPTWPRCFDITTVLGSHIIEDLKLDTIFKKSDIPKTSLIDTDLLAEDISLTLLLDTIIGLQVSPVVHAQLTTLFKKLDIGKPFSVDFIISLLSTVRCFDINTVFGTSGIEPLTIDSVFKKLGIPVTAQIDTIISSLGFAKTSSIDALFKALDLPKVLTLDLFIKAILPKTFTIDVDIEKQLTKTILINMILQSIFTRALLIDGLFQKQDIIIATVADAYFKALDVVRSHTIDSIFRQPSGIRSFSIDSDFIKEDLSRCFDITTVISSISAAASLFLLDSLFKKPNLSKALGIDVDFSKEHSISLTADNILKKLDIPITATFDTIIQSLGTIKLPRFDVVFKALNLPKTSSIDSIFSKLDIPKTLSIDSYLKANDALKAFLLDNVFLKEVSKAFAIDVILGVFGLASMHLDTIFSKADIPLAKTIDALFQKGFSSTFLIDQYYLKAVQKALSIDSIEKASDIHSSFSMDVGIGTSGIFNNRSLGSSEVIDNLSDHYGQFPRSDTSIEKVSQSSMEVI